MQAQYLSYFRLYSREIQGQVQRLAREQRNNGMDKYGRRKKEEEGGGGKKGLVGVTTHISLSPWQNHHHHKDQASLSYHLTITLTAKPATHGKREREARVMPLFLNPSFLISFFFFRPGKNKLVMV